MFLSNQINVSDLIGVFFFVGTAIIYIPQYYKFYQCKSNRGFSPTFMFLGHLAALLAMVNGLLLTYPTWSMSFILLVWQWLLFMSLYLMFLHYHVATDPFAYVLQFDEETLDPIHEMAHHENLLNEPSTFTETLHRPIRRYTSNLGKKTLKVNRYLITYKASRLLFLMSIAIGFSALSVAIVLLSIHSETLKYSDSLDVIITALFLIHYLPQLYQTYRLKTVGSMSLLTLALTCFGTYLWAVYLWFQNNSGIWIPYVMVATMQLSLLIMGTVYERR